MKILITSGGTKIAIDLVRNISNMSKGTFGSDICKAFIEKGHNVDFLMAEGSKTPFKLELNSRDKDRFDKYNTWACFVDSYRDNNYREFKYKTFQDYKDNMEALLSYNKYDMVILAAAVSDFGVENVVDGKIRSQEDMSIKLKALPKIIGTVKTAQPKTFLVGFKLLVNSTDKALINDSEMSIEKNGCDMVVANDLRDIKQDNHRLLVVHRENNNTIIKEMTKNEAESYGLTLAEKLVERVIEIYGRKSV